LPRKLLPTLINMLKEIGLGAIAQRKIAVLNLLREIKKKRPDYTIIDIGGGKEKHVDDKFDFIDACADLRDVNHKDVKHFRGNINDPYLWEEIKQYVEANGKFNYCICTHTLEDIAFPSYVASQIQTIANEGIITVPSKYRECCRFELNNLIRGYSHHRWILTVKNNSILAFPKVNLIEDPFFDVIAKKSLPINDELYILWEKEIPFKIINDDWLGPNPPTCLEMYKRELSVTDEDNK